MRREKTTLSLEIQTEPGVTYRTEFIGTRKNYDRANEPVLDPSGKPLRVTRKYSKDVGAVLATVEGATASYTVKGDEIYVRAKIISSKIKAAPYSKASEVEQAWTQPLVTGVK